MPSSGKTTIIRDIARVLSRVSRDMKNVVVVDTSNEICGDGDIPHFSVGMARRMMVPNLDQQASVFSIQLSGKHNRIWKADEKLYPKPTSHRLFVIAENSYISEIS